MVKMSITLYVQHLYINTEIYVYVVQLHFTFTSKLCIQIYIHVQNTVCVYNGIKCEKLLKRARITQKRLQNVYTLYMMNEPIYAY